MPLRIFATIPEALTYLLLLLVLVVNIGGGFFMLRLVRQQQHDTQVIQQQVTCVATYFVNGDGGIGAIDKLQACQGIVKQLQK